MWVTRIRNLYVWGSAFALTPDKKTKSETKIKAKKQSNQVISPFKGRSKRKPSWIRQINRSTKHVTLGRTQMVVQFGRCRLVHTYIQSYKSAHFPVSNVYGHITLKTPVLVRTPKLSNVEPGQYVDGWPLWNPGCRSLNFLFFFYSSSPVFIITIIIHNRYRYTPAFFQKCQSLIPSLIDSLVCIIVFHLSVTVPRRHFYFPAK